jgi:ankyrin repeat protein
MPVQPLPANPDLGKLRDLAKLLRDLVRQNDEGAIAVVAEHHPRLRDLAPDDPRTSAFTLSSAQLTIARHHGLASWAKLKRQVELRVALARSPHGQPVGAPVGRAADLADELLRLACLTYGSPDPTRPAQARVLLDEHPELADYSIHTMAAAGNHDGAAALLRTDPGAAARSGGPFDWPPLLYATYSRLPGTDTLPVARLLLEAGADPNAGYLWEGLIPPFTALTGALGGGERAEPPHPRALELAAALLEAGADANDGQSLYNRGPGDVARDDTDWLELLLHHGLGRGDGGPWYALLAPSLPTPRALLGEALQHAAEAGLPNRVRVLLRFGADPNGRGLHPLFRGRSAYQGAVVNGHADVATLLEAGGADQSTVDGPTRLIGALLVGDGHQVEQLLAGQADVLASVRRDHPDLVVRAAELGRIEAIRLLVACGFDVDACPRATALHEAAYRGDDESVRTLLDLGADPAIEDLEFHATPKGWAEHAGHLATAALLDRAR